MASDLDFGNQLLPTLSITGLTADQPEGNADNTSYTFTVTRSGVTSDASSVNWSVSGSGSNPAVGSDFSGGSFPTGIVSFAAGESSQMITVDVLGDTTLELDEGFTVTLTGPSSAILDPAATSASGTIHNDDYAPIERVGNSTLLRRLDGAPFAQVGDAFPIEITSPWRSPVGSSASEWQMLAIDTIEGVNQLLWRNNSANFLHTWILDSNWNWTASIGMVDPTSAEGWTLENQFQVDANGDGVIGTSLATVESGGRTTLLRRNDGAPYAQIRNTSPIEITSPWGSPVGSSSSEWQMLGVETIAEVNQVLWRNNTGNFLHTWILDSNWNWTASIGMVEPTSAEGLSLESQFQVDANVDGLIGSPFSIIKSGSSFDAIESGGGTSLLRRNDGAPFAQAGDAPPIEIISPWGSPVGSSSTDWQMLAIDTITGVNQLLWRNNNANFLHTWTLDSNWNWTASVGVVDPTSAVGWSLENQFQVDANGDGLIGASFATIESGGGTTLLRRADGAPFAQVGTGSRIEITSPWGSPVGSSDSEWQMLGVDTIAGINQVLWRNNSANFLHTWILDSNWNWTHSIGMVNPDSAAGRNLENQFQVDANADGVVGFL